MTQTRKKQAGKRAARPLMAGALAALLLSGCAVWPGTAPRLNRDGETYTLSQPFADFYKFALVQTDGTTQMARPVSLDEAADILSTYDVVFIGEAHRHSGNHLAQMEIYRRLYERNPNLSLSLEQFERDVQPVLDAFMAGEIGEETLRERGRAWDNYPTSYRPLVEFSKERGLPVIAAEVPTWIVRCVGKMGPDALDKLSPEQRPWAAAELNLHDGPYKDKYLSFLGANASHGDQPDKTAATHSGPSQQALNSFAAQVTRDDTMAESIYLHLKENPGRKVVHLDGSFHSESFLGTVERLQLRMPDLKIAVVNPIQVEDPKAPSFTTRDMTTGTLLLLTYPVPKDYVTQEEMREQIKKVMSKRQSKTCPL